MTICSQELAPPGVPAPIVLVVVAAFKPIVISVVLTLDTTVQPAMLPPDAS